MPKTKTRRTYKCGKCQQTGHNARTCTTGNVKATITVSAPINLTAEAAKVEEPKPVLVPMDATQDLTEIRRGPSGRPKDVASPYTCPSCTSIAVLVLVEYGCGVTSVLVTQASQDICIRVEHTRDDTLNLVA